jgi:hypothetical protein
MADKCDLCGGDLDANFLDRRSLDYECKKCHATFSMAYLAIRDMERLIVDEFDEENGYTSKW